MIARKHSSNHRANASNFSPETILRDWGGGDGFHIVDATMGVAIFGATGSGKTSGPGHHLACGFLAAGFGGIVLCSKAEECGQWEAWAAATGRSDDLIIIAKGSGKNFNFLEWEAQRAGNGAGLTVNMVALLMAIAGAIGAGQDGGDKEKFWQDALQHMLSNLVDLILLARMPVTLPLLRSIVSSAPLSVEQMATKDWKTQTCAAILQEAEEATNHDPAARADLEECRTYWTVDFPSLSDKTRSIILLTFSMLIRPFVTDPLRTLFSTDTTVRPEDTFEGKVIIVDLPVQEFRLVGRIAQLAWKYCFQIAVLRRSKPVDGFLRPVFLWADEAQNFLFPSGFDAEYQAVARSSGGCTVYLTQNRETYKRVLGNDAAVDSLLGNLQTKFFCQNSSIETNEWSSRLLGERYLNITGTNVGRSDEGRIHAGTSLNEQRRHFLEPAQFTTLKRGGEAYGGLVEAFVYKGGTLFETEVNGRRELLPYRLLTFRQ